MFIIAILEGKILKNGKEDRRIRRTQKLLKDSLVKLMSRKEFKDITIKEITELADLNRGTFYLHYSDTYGLLKSMETDVLDDFQEMIDNYLKMGPETNLLPVLVPIIHYIVENTEICQNLFENNFSSDFHKDFKNLIHKNGLTIIEKLFPNYKSSASDYFFEFITYGLIGILKKWLDSGMPQSEEEIGRICSTSVMAVAQSFFGPLAG